MSSLNPKKITKYFKDLRPPDIQQLLRSGQKFTDPYFPPDYNSLTSRNPDGSFVDSEKGQEQLDFMEEDEAGISQRVIWKRVTEVKSNVKWEVFQKGITFDDVNQGCLGDCYFLSAISALCEFPYLIKEKFRTDTFNQAGYYELILFIDGEWQIIFLDDYFPYDPKIRNFAFAKPNGPELWALLLEKAWAKVNGGYSNIIAGLFSEAIAALTGFPSESILSDSIDPLDLYYKVEKADQEGTIMSSSSKEDSKIKKKGLVTGHAYTLIGAKAMENKKIYLLKLRNPWGEEEWTGAWSDKSDKWTPELKRYFNYENKNDGIFWIDVENYVQNFNYSYICYLLYGAIIKSYFFEYEKYFYYPVVFNIEIKQKSKTSISALFKGERFNRNLHNVVRPFSMVLCQYDRQRKIKQMYGKFTLNDDKSIIEDLDPGFYVLWAYCSYKDIKGDPNFKYTLIVSSMKEFNIEFIGFDNNFLLIQHLILENYKRTGATNLQASKDYFIGNDAEPSKYGINNILMFNKTNAWLVIEATYSQKAGTARLFPPYEGLQNFSVTIPPHQATALLSITTSSSCRIAYKNKIAKHWKDDPVPPENNFDEFLHLTITNDADALSDLRTGCIRYVAREKVEQIPSFDQSQFIGKSILKMSMSRKEEVTPESLAREYPYEITVLNENYEALNDGVPLYLDKIQNPQGIYFGEIDRNTGNLHGKGVFIWNNGTKYIGYFRKGKMDINGILFDANNTMLFYGQYTEGKRNGKGRLIISKDEYYEGDFVNEKMEGKGKYHFANGDVWEGSFSNNMKNGVGVVIYANNPGVKYLAEYENDHFMGKKAIFENEFNYLISQKKKKEEQKKKQQQEGFIKGFGKILKEKDLERELFENKSKLNASVLVHQISRTIVETDEEKKHNEFLENLEELKKNEPFMIEQIQDVQDCQDMIDDFKLIVFDQRTQARYLGNVINGMVKHGRGGLFNGNLYYFGKFNNDYPTGVFTIFNEKKLLIFKGILDQNYVKVKGKYYYESGDHYVGSFFNDKPNGYGSYFFANGASWTGYFNNGVFNGVGLYYFDNGLLTETVTYSNNSVIKREQFRREDFNTPTAQQFIAQVTSYYPGVMERILKYPPARNIEGLLEWTQLNYQDGSIYIGQKTSDGKLGGRCCYIYNNQNNSTKYYVGYIKNNQLHGLGAYYDANWKLIYYGKLKKDKRHGFGHEFYPDGSRYSGYFSDGVFNGAGVFYYPNGSRIEGHYLNGQSNDVSYIILNDLAAKQKVKYDNGNIIEQEEIINCKKFKYQKLMMQEFFVFKTLYREDCELFLSLEKTADSDVLRRTGIEKEEGLYIGEINNVGFRHGRGLQRKYHSKEFYLGYFVDDLREGFGKIYYEKGKIKYDGCFHFDKPFGKGKYYFTNGDVLEGTFDEVGQGNGIYTYSNGTKWQGTFYAWMLHGNGTLLDSQGRALGYKSYDLNRALN